MNDINGLMFQFNEYHYEENKIYVSYGIKCGVVYQNYAVNGEMKHVNAAVPLLMERIFERQNINVNIKYHIQQNMFMMSFSTSAENFQKDMDQFLDGIYHLSYTKENFKEDHEALREGYVQKYKSEKFRGWCKMLEYTNQQNGFARKVLSMEINEMTYEEVMSALEIVLLPKNTFLYVNGCIDALSSKDISSWREKIPAEETDVQIVSSHRDARMIQDAHVVEMGREEHQISCMYVSFLNKAVTNLDKIYLMNLWKSSCGFIKPEVSVDHLDAAMIYYNLKLETHKDEVYTFITKENYDEHIKKLMVEYATELDQYPYLWGKDAVDFYLLGADISQYLQLLSESTYEDYNNVLMNSDIKVNEAQVVMNQWRGTANE